MVEEFASYRRGQLQDGQFELIRGLASSATRTRLRSTVAGRSPPGSSRFPQVARG